MENSRRAKLTRHTFSVNSTAVCVILSRCSPCISFHHCSSAGSVSVQKTSRALSVEILLLPSNIPFVFPSLPT